MNNKKEKYLIVFVLLLLLGIGYAALSSTLNIIGISNIAKSNWDVHFANITLRNESVEINTTEYPDAQESTIDVLDPTKLSYNVLLSEPGDFYEFNVDVVNDGTLDAMISAIESKIKIGDSNETLLTNETLPEYLLYSVTYSNGTQIDMPHELKSKDKDNLLVRIEFKKDITNAQYEEAVGKVLNFKMKINYVQSTLGEVANNQNTFVDSNPCTYEGELEIGATYTGTQYKYVYKQDRYGNGLEEDGWSMQLIDPDSTDPITETMCSSINGKPIVSMRYLFYSSQAESIDLSSFNTTNVTDMGYMFHYSQATNLNLSSFNTSKVTNMEGMFESSRAESLDLRNFDTSNVTNMYDMFEDAAATSINVSSFNTSKVNSMRYMFAGVNVEELDLSSFDFNSDTDVEYMFERADVTTCKLKDEMTSNILSYKENVGLPSTTYEEPMVYPETEYAVAIGSSYAGGSPNRAVFRNNYATAIDDWNLLDSHNSHANTFLKYDLNNNTRKITNVLLGFEVTDTTVSNVPTAVPGVYYLNPSDSYETNKNKAQNAIDPGNTDSKCSEDDEGLSCDGCDLFIIIKKNGSMSVAASYSGSMACVIEDSGASYCRK